MRSLYKLSAGTRSLEHYETYQTPQNWADLGNATRLWNYWIESVMRETYLPEVVFRPCSMVGPLVSDFFLISSALADSRCWSLLCLS